MMTKNTNPFKIGDIVETIDDSISGKVINTASDMVTFEDEHGFEFQFLFTELIMKSPERLHSKIDNDDVELAKQHKTYNDNKRRSKSHLKHSDRSFTVDLHIDKLVDSTRGMSNFDMLNLQLETAKGQLEFAMNKRMMKIVFIHGVGEGVLKMELHTLLRRYDNVKFYDADFRTYGLGATEVRIFQNT